MTVEPTENREEAKADEPKIEAVKSIYDYKFEVATIQQELIAIGTEMGLEVDSSLTPIRLVVGQSGNCFKRFSGQKS